MTNQNQIQKVKTYLHNLSFDTIGDSPDWFLQTIKNIIDSTEDTPKAPALRFNLSYDAAVHNMRLLQSHNNDLQQYLKRNKDTFIGFGFEFRQTHILEPLLIHHPNWLKLKNLLEEGSNWKLDKMSEKDSIAKNSEFITRENHKSAKKYDPELCKTIEKELQQGWMFPLPLKYISSLKHGELAPVGMDDKQWQELPNGN
jgi:hypothetical protein